MSSSGLSVLCYGRKLTQGIYAFEHFSLLKIVYRETVFRITTSYVKHVVVHTKCDNLIPGMVAAFRWGIEVGQIMYPSTFEHVPTCVYMSYRPSSRGSSVLLVEK
jgi:hypothetical protein